MKLAIASDHAGYTVKQHLVNHLRTTGFDIADLGVDTDAMSSDYPDAAEKVATAILEGRAERGILVCGSGVGVSIAANKFPGIYACLVHDTYSAHQGVEHDRMNVICIGGRVIGPNLAAEIVDAFIAAQPMDVDRYTARFEQVRGFEKKYQGSAE